MDASPRSSGACTLTVGVVNLDQAGEGRQRPGEGERLEEMFAAQARRTPERPALLHRGVALTYEEVERRSNQFAAYLRERGYGRGTILGICHPRTPDLVVIVLAVLKAGAAYLPLAPEDPDEHLRRLIADGRPAAVVTHSSLVARFTGLPPCIAVDAEADAIAAQPAAALASQGDADDTAQVLYTSGTTGEPKGVVLAHTARHLIAWGRRAYQPCELACVAATSSIRFDPSILEIFLPLSSGGAVLIKENALEPFGVAERPTMLTGVPSALAALAEVKAIPDSVEVINCGGERVPEGLVARLFQASRARRIFNHYGPTEASICVAASVVERGGAGELARLRAIPGVRLRVLDEALAPVAPGGVGELHIAGRTLAKGYLRRPDLTAERFLPDVSGVGGERMYRTGDRARIFATGEVEVLGRSDEQVKVRGHRVELGAVEAALDSLPSVRRAVATVEAGEDGELALVAWVEADQPLSLHAVRHSLSARLPSHMIPTRVERLARLPLTASGKVDRKRLSPGVAEPAAPRGRAEAAADHYEMLVVHVFGQHLSKAVGLDDDFFDHGGSSLLALKAMAQLAALFNRPLPTSAIFSERTPRRLGALLSRSGEGGMRHAVALRSQGNKPPLFCSSDFHGLPTSYLALTDRLAADQPLYVLSPGPFKAEMIRKPSIVRLVQAYLKEMRAIQPQGPYHVCGYSAGAAMALAVACALEGEGEDVSLILLDPVVAGRTPPLSFTAGWLVAHLLPSIRAVGLVPTARQVQRIRHTWLRAGRTLTLRDVPKGVPISERDLARAMLQAEVDGPATPFGGSTLLVQGARVGVAEAYIDWDGTNGLSPFLAGSVTRFRATAGHVEMMREPAVAVIAALIGRAMAETPEARPTRRPAPAVEAHALAIVPLP